MKIRRRHGIDELIMQGLVHGMIHPKVVQGNFVEARGFQYLGPCGGIDIDKDALMLWSHKGSGWDNSGILCRSRGLS